MPPKEKAKCYHNRSFIFHIFSECRPSRPEILFPHKLCLDLDLLNTVLPDDNIGGNTILTVIHEDNPAINVSKTS